MLLSVYECIKKSVSSIFRLVQKQSKSTFLCCRCEKLFDRIFRHPFSLLFIHFSSFFRKMPVLARQVLRIGGKTGRIDRIFAAFSRPLTASVQEPPRETKEKEKMPSSNSNLVMKYHKVLPEASTPTKGSAKAAGYDLKSAENIVVPARGKALVDTGLKIEVPEGCYGRIAPRSGLAVKNFIDVGAGVVDEDYRGVIKVVLFNHSDAPFEVKKGDRIAQFICERIYYPELQEVKAVSETQRGEGGFGSTGTN